MNIQNNLHLNSQFFKKILSLVILFIILFSIAGLLIYLKTFLKKEDVPYKKTQILNRLELYEAGKSLKEDEKQEIFETLSETKIQEYNFSKEEKMRLLKALNEK